MTEQPEGLVDALQRDLWAGQTILSGKLPQFPNIAALPAASVDYRGKVALVLGAAGAADVLSICLKAAANTYSWKTLATG